MGSKAGRPRILGAVAWLAVLGSFSSNSFAIDDHVDGSVASHATNACAETSSPGPASRRRRTALSEAIHQNTRGNSQGYPAGLSLGYGRLWYDCTQTGAVGILGSHSMGSCLSRGSRTGKCSERHCTGHRFRDLRSPHQRNVGQVQDQAQDGIGGAHYTADFSNNANIPWDEQTLSDGSVSFDAPPSGYNDHFWPSVRGTFTPGTVDGIFVEAKMKTNDPDAHL